MNFASDLLADAATRLRDASIENPRREARLLWEHARTISLAHAERGRGQGEGASTDVLKHQDPLSPTFVREREILFEKIVQRRAAREPFAYITGKKEFWNLSFAVGPGVLVPRPETETLIEDALRVLPNRNAHLRILDLGVGSGCLLLTLLHLFPNAGGVGVDASDQALGYAAHNAKKLGVDSRCRLLKQDWSEFEESGFDLIVSNPPYIESDVIALLSPEVARYEPHAALDGGADGLDCYRAFASVVNRFLALSGTLLLELGFGQADMVSMIFQRAGFDVTGVSPDLSGTPRCLTLRAGMALQNSPARNRLESAA